MAADCDVMTLREAGVELIDCEHKTPAPVPVGVPYVAIPQMRDGRIDLESARRISEADFIEWTRKANPRDGDVVLSRRTNPGETAVAPPGAKFALGQNLVLLRSDGTHVDSGYLRWLVRSPAWWGQIQRHLNVGAVFDSLKCADVPNFELPIPPLPEQRRIAHILGTLDDKIELNRRMNETLEAMARALFKSWFVDFDPVRAKAEGRDPGLPPHLADLFPSRLVDSPLRPIPEGWDVSAISDHADCVKGRSYSSEELRESDTALVTLKSFARGGGYRPDGLKPYVGPYKEEQVVSPGDLIVAATDVTQAAEVIGKPALVESNGRFSTLVASLDVLIVRPVSQRLPASFLYWLFRDEAFEQHTYSHTSGTTVLHLGRNAVPSYRFPLPPQPLVNAFDALASALFARADTAVTESVLLARARGTLLPRLIGGEA